jgi:hypothetical protein
MNNFLILFVLFFSSISCRNSANYTNKKNSSTDQNLAQPSSKEASLGNLFSDGESFSLQDVKEGKTCGSVRNGNLTFTFVQWPGELKKWLAGELAKMKFKKSATEKLHGIYLANYSNDIGTGLTCHDAKSDKMVVLINAKLVTRERRDLSQQVMTTPNDLRPLGIPVLEDRGDAILQTFVHEMFHVIDLAYYLDDLADSLEGKAAGASFRQTLYEMSWKEPLKSRFGEDKAEATELALTATSIKNIDAHPLKKHSGLFLADEASPPQDEMQIWLNENKWIATQTNFFSTYAKDNFLEDFAVSLEAIYSGKAYDTWYRVEFFAPLEKFLLSTKALIESSPSHREKACFIRKEFFGDPCS